MEFSQHSGTIEFGKIRNRLMFCARFIELSKRERFECGGERALAKLFDRGLAELSANNANKSPKGDNHGKIRNARRRENIGRQRKPCLLIRRPTHGRLCASLRQVARPMTAQ